jgi:hypothetical protein
MPRRKLYKISAKDTTIYDVIVSELQKNPELAADYDMNTIEISVKKKITPHIQDIDKAIDNLKSKPSVKAVFLIGCPRPIFAVKKDSYVFPYRNEYILYMHPRNRSSQRLQQACGRC